MIIEQVMKCSWIVNLIPQYSEGTLDEYQLDLINQHLENCSDCSLELDDFDRLLSLVTNVEIKYPLPAVWNNFWADLRWKIESPQVDQRPALRSLSWHHIGIWKFASIGCVLLLTVLLWLQLFNNSPSAHQLKSLAPEDLQVVNYFFGGIPVGQILEQINSEEQEAEFAWESNLVLNLESVELTNLFPDTIAGKDYLTNLSDFDLPTYPSGSLDGAILTSMK